MSESKDRPDRLPEKPRLDQQAAPLHPYPLSENPFMNNPAVQTAIEQIARNAAIAHQKELVLHNIVREASGESALKPSKETATFSTDSPPATSSTETPEETYVFDRLFNLDAPPISALDIRFERRQEWDGDRYREVNHLVLLVQCSGMDAETREEIRESLKGELESCGLQPHWSGHGTKDDEIIDLQYDEELPSAIQKVGAILASRLQPDAQVTQYYDNYPATEAVFKEAFSAFHPSATLDAALERLAEPFPGTGIART